MNRGQQVTCAQDLQQRYNQLCFNQFAWCSSTPEAPATSPSIGSNNVLEQKWVLQV